jgi:hypothetical protein
LLSVAPAHIGSCKFRLRQRAVPVRTQPACAIPGRRRNFLGGSYRATHPRSRKSAVGEGLGHCWPASTLSRGSDLPAPS